MKDEDNKLGRLLSRLYRSFKNGDPNPVQQKALPACVLREVARMNSSETQKATSQISFGAFFFAMTSCEYLKVPQAESVEQMYYASEIFRFFRNEPALVRQYTHHSPLKIGMKSLSN